MEAAPPSPLSTPPSQRSASGDEGSPGHSPSPRARSVFHERSGLWIMPLRSVSRDRCVSMYHDLQRDGALFKQIGLQGDELRAYAAFIVDAGRATKWSCAAVDRDSGEVKGMNIFVANVGDIDASELPPIAADHWQLFVRLERAYRVGAGVDTGRQLCCIFTGITPACQGRGLFSPFNRYVSDCAADHGFTRWWSWTCNPNLIKALGANDVRVVLISRVAQYFFTMPPALSNFLINHVAINLGLVPPGNKTMWIPLRSLGIERMASIEFNPMVSNNDMITTEMDKRARERREKRRQQAAKRRLPGRIRTLLLLLLALILAAMTWRRV